MSKITFISYAVGDIYLQKRERLENCIRAQGITDIRSYGPEDVDADFSSRNEDAMTTPNLQLRGGQLVEVGAGCCLWKPHLIMKTLYDVNNDDIVVYMDADDTITGQPNLQNYLHDKTQLNNGYIGIMSTRPVFPNRDWTRRDAFILMGHDSEDYWDQPQLEAGFIVLKKNLLAFELLGAWLAYGHDVRVLGCPPNQFGADLPGFKEHRYDQAIYSLLVRRFGLQPEHIYNSFEDYGMTYSYNVPL